MISNRNLLIIGASGHGKVVADIAIKMEKWSKVAFLDDSKCNEKSFKYSIVGKTADAIKFRDETDFFVAIGDNGIRKEIQEKLLEENLNVVSLVEPTAIIGSDVELGVGTCVMAGVVINSSTKVGKGCVINTSSSLDHDNVINDYVHISPGARTSGNVIVGHNTWLGIGSVVSNNIKICKDSIVGAGAVVIRDIIKPGTYIGIPARRVF